MSVDTVLHQREAAGNPIRVGTVGAGATGRAIAPNWEPLSQGCDW